MNKEKVILCGTGKLIGVIFLPANTFGFVDNALEVVKDPYDRIAKALSLMPKVPYGGLTRNVGNYNGIIATEKQDKHERIKALLNKSLKYQPNRFLNKELQKYQFKKSV